MAGIVEEVEYTAGHLHKVVMDLHILLGVLMYFQKIANFYFASTQQHKVDFYFFGPYNNIFPPPAICFINKVFEGAASNKSSGSFAALRFVRGGCFAAKSKIC